MIRHEYKGEWRTFEQLRPFNPATIAEAVARWAQYESGDRWDLVTFVVMGESVHAVFRRTPE